MAYPLVTITNSTNFYANGTVEYLSGFCSNDDYTANGFSSWTATDRGTCLVSGITATVTTPSGPVTAIPYSSTGTSYSQFAIVQLSAGSFQVTRLSNAAEDVMPATHEQPTTKQK